MRETVQAKAPPHSIEGEQSVLGALMLSRGAEEAWDVVSDILSKEDFYRLDHALIFEAIRKLRDEGKSTDFITVAECLERNGELEDAGGHQYLRDLVKSVPSAKNIANYANIIKGYSLKRDMIRVSDNMIEIAYEPEGRSPEELIDEAEASVYALSEKTSKMTKGPVAIRQALIGAVEKIDELHLNDNAITGVPTAWSDFNQMTAGLQPSDLIIVAARPSMGKTSFAMNIAEHAAARVELPTLVFSLEMPTEQLATRMLSSLGRIDAHRLRTGRLDDKEWPKLTDAASTLASKPLYIDDTAGLTPTELRSRARRLSRQSGLGLIVIDYLQLMRIPTARSRTEEISEISRQLKALAKELNVPVIALSQLNRALEQRPNKRPVMSDLRESGGIEQDADMIVFLYRDEVYNEDSPDAGVAEIIIGKQRNGPIGTCRLTWQGQYTRFENFIPEQDDDYPTDYGKSGLYQP